MIIQNQNHFEMKAREFIDKNYILIRVDDDELLNRIAIIMEEYAIHVLSHSTLSESKVMEVLDDKISIRWKDFKTGIHGKENAAKQISSLSVVDIAQVGEEDWHAPTCSFGTNVCMICGKTVDEHFLPTPEEIENAIQSVLSEYMGPPKNDRVTTKILAALTELNK